MRTKSGPATLPPTRDGHARKENNVSSTSIATPATGPRPRPVTADEFEQLSRAYGEAFADEPRHGRHAPVNVVGETLNGLTLTAGLRAGADADEWLNEPGRHRAEES